MQSSQKSARQDRVGGIAHEESRIISYLIFNKVRPIHFCLNLKNKKLLPAVLKKSRRRLWAQCTSRSGFWLSKNRRIGIALTFRNSGAPFSALPTGLILLLFSEAVLPCRKIPGGIRLAVQIPALCRCMHWQKPNRGHVVFKSLCLVVLLPKNTNHLRLYKMASQDSPCTSRRSGPHRCQIHLSKRALSSLAAWNHASAVYSSTTRICFLRHIVTQPALSVNEMSEVLINCCAHLLNIKETSVRLRG